MASAFFLVGPMTAIMLHPSSAGLELDKTENRNVLGDLLQQQKLGSGRGAVRDLGT
ncbi:MAG: hypothetical protein IPP00_15635 [Actinomycetales bacterium]|uniref:Uncharacterized protein n=1 Tax=Candidatus Phosphoribacter hodrii TaxID=2953743 RepID=A0A9D7Y0L9_9MICO|nr:hypothetical protein [Candidatus Phosphoribacter hodrii]